MQILINSCFKYYKNTVPVLVESLKHSGLENIDVVIGDSPKEYQVIEDSVHKYFVPYNNFDVTAFIFVIEANYQKDFMYLHDTCRAGPSFGRLLTDKLHGFNFDCAKLTNSGLCMNMGYYSHTFVHKHKDIILPIKMTTSTHDEVMESKKRALINEDFLIKRAGSSINLARGRNVSDKNIYSENRRIEEYFPDLDLYKYKANWDLSRYQINVDL